jgi:hypothetical protein
MAGRDFSVVLDAADVTIKNADWLCLSCFKNASSRALMFVML